MNPSLKTLSGETQRIATDALAQGTLSKEDLLAAVVLLKVQRNDARAENKQLLALLERSSLALSGERQLLAEIRFALAGKVTP